MAKGCSYKVNPESGFETILEHILFSNGAQNAIAATLASLCKPGERIGVDQHTYPGLKTVAAMLNVQIVPIKSENMK